MAEPRYKVDSHLRAHMKKLVVQHGGAENLGQIAGIGSGVVNRILLGQRRTIREDVLDRVLTRAHSDLSIHHFTLDRRMFCSSCGCKLDERAPGCETCSRRHHNRAKRARNRGQAGKYVPILFENNGKKHGNCVECACSYDSRTIGCGTCARRHWQRRRKGLEYLSAEEGTRAEGRGKVAERILTDFFSHLAGYVSSEITLRQMKVLVDYNLDLEIAKVGEMADGESSTGGGVTYYMHGEKRDLRDPQAMGEALALLRKQYPHLRASEIADLIEEISIPNYPGHESTVTETVRQYKDDLFHGALSGDRYAARMLKDMYPETYDLISWVLPQEMRRALGDTSPLMIAEGALSLSH